MAKITKVGQPRVAFLADSVIVKVMVDRSEKPRWSAEPRWMENSRSSSANPLCSLRLCGEKEV